MAEEIRDSPDYTRYVLLLTIYDLDFMAMPYSGYAPLKVTFEPTIVGGLPPYSCLWEFGDGTTSTEFKPTKVYDKPGNYVVRLTVTDALGNVAKTVKNVSVIVPFGWVVVSLADLSYALPVDVKPALAVSLAPLAYDTPTDTRPALTASTDIPYTTPTDVKSALALTTDLPYTVTATVT